MVMPRAFSSGAASIWSYALKVRAAGLCQNLGDRCGQRGLAMVDVTDGADVAVRLIAGKLFLAHRFSVCVSQPADLSFQFNFKH